MTKHRHSYVAFFPSDWLAGTARMTRIVKSVYFDICLYNWDKNEAVPESELTLMLADLEGQGLAILKALLKSGRLHLDEDGGVYNTRAMEESSKAFVLWNAKSQGGKRARGSAAAKEKSDDTSNQSSNEARPDSSTEKEKEPEKEKENLADSVPTGLVVSPSENDTPTEPIEPPLPEGDGEEEQEEDVPASAISKEDIATMADAWNTMAVACGLSQVTKLTEDRRKKMRGRIKDHGIDEIVAAIQTVPASPFLTGKRTKWKADFDFVLQVKSMNKLVEGAYHNEGSDPSQGSAWR